jgi:hypothetical protein
MLRNAAPSLQAWPLRLGIASVACFGLFALTCALLHPSIGGGYGPVLFLRPEFAPLVYTFLPLSSLLLWLALIPLAIVYRRRQRFEQSKACKKALGVSAILNIALLICVGLGTVKTWDVVGKTVGKDRKTYYLLHCPPPLHGGGSWAIARRDAANPLVVLTNVVYYSPTGFGSAERSPYHPNKQPYDTPEVRQVTEVFAQHLPSPANQPLGKL